MTLLRMVEAKLRWFINGLRKEYYAPTRVWTRIPINTFLSIGAFFVDELLVHVGWPKKQTLPTAVYDLRICPNTFDFAYFLFQADVHFRKCGFSQFAVLILNIDPGFSEAYEKVIDAQKRNDRVKNMLSPMAEMYQGCASVEVLVEQTELIDRCKRRKPIFPLHADGKHLRTHNYVVIHDYLMREKAAFSGFKAPEWAVAEAEKLKQMHGITGRYVTLTVRSYAYQPLRNTDMDAYLEFADYLQDRGYAVIFIPDADSSFEVDFKNWPVLPEACANIFLRMAFYEQAITNVFTSNGLHALAALNMNGTFINAGQLNEAYPDSTGARRHLADGLKVGDQPFAHRHSRFIWAKETFSNLKANFEIIEAALGMHMVR